MDVSILDEDSRKAMVQLSEHTADPRAVVHHIQDMLNHPEPDVVQRLISCLTHPIFRRRLVLVFGNTPYLSNVIRRWPEFLPKVDEKPDLLLENQQLKEKMLQTDRWDEAARLLRHHKMKWYFYIGSRDLTGEASLNEVVHTLSELADGTLEAGFCWLDKKLSSRFGQPMILLNNQPVRAGFVIIGMGKLGAHELNFSSDVDLIYLFDSGDGEVEKSCSLSIKAYYNRLGRDLIRLLGESTSDGQVFRIDLRLRPEGESGDLSLSCRSAELYYESWGRTWERAAMIKARPVAGDISLGNRFIKSLRPFVFRRYLDFAALDAIREMKRKIDRKITLAQDYHRNVKLGYGGIREIEFFVQSQQLIHGGKNPDLRHRSTLKIVDNLYTFGWLEKENALFLKEAYRFLRTLEHRLQIKDNQQLHSIPEESEAFEQLAKRMNYSNGSTLRNRLTQMTDGVHAIYQGLFYEAGQTLQTDNDSIIETLLECEPGEKVCLELLSQAGFNDPEQAGNLMGILRDGPRRSGLTELACGWYKRIAVPLLQEILQAPDQDMAIHHAETFLTALGHRVNYLALLLENPPVLKLLVRLFGASPLLSKYFVKHPELMDQLVTRDFFQHYRNHQTLSKDLSRLLEDQDNQEERFDIIRNFKNSESLRLGIRDLSGVAELTEVMSGLSILADVILLQVMQESLLEMEKRFGVPRWSDGEKIHRAPFVIVAMGKLGGKELNYSSDLDLIFIHGGQGDEQWTDGKRSLSNSQFFTRLGQKIITGITTLTRSGKLYELDMRLRPSGNSGALVISEKTFIKYQKNEAWVWEHQALSRARIVAGDSKLAKSLQHQIRQIVLESKDPETIRSEVFNMRQRMYEEKKPKPDWIDIKQSRGGIVDIEFLAQFFILAYAHHHPDIVHTNTTRALQAFKNVGLLDLNQCTLLEEAYGFFRLVENRLRLLHDRSENAIGPDPIIKEQLRRLCNLPENSDIVSILTEYFNSVFPIIQKFLDNPI